MDPRIMFSLSLTLRDSVLSFLAFFNLLSGKNAWILMKKMYIKWLVSLSYYILIQIKGLSGLGRCMHSTVCHSRLFIVARD